VGTVALTHALQELPDASALGVVAVNADSLLGGTDFRGTERAWQAVAALGRLARAHDAPLLVLTRKPDAPTTQRLLQNESVFLAAERADRASANYPPMARLVTVTSAGATPAAAMTAAKAAKAALTAALPANPALRPTLFGPYPAGTPLRHGSWRAAFAIKTPALTPELRASLAKIPETCSIDTNPESPE
jgi:primosomal protein N'